MRRKNKGNKVVRQCIVYAMAAMIAAGSLAPSQTVKAEETQQTTSVQSANQQAEAAKDAADDAEAAAKDAADAVADADGKLNTAISEDQKERSAMQQDATASVKSQSASDTVSAAVNNMNDTTKSELDSYAGNNSNEVGTVISDTETNVDAAVTVSVTNADGTVSNVSVDSFAEGKAVEAEQNAAKAKDALSDALAVNTNVVNQEVRDKVQEVTDAAAAATQCANAAANAAKSADTAYQAAITSYNQQAYIYGLVAYPYVDASGNTTYPGYPIDASAAATAGLIKVDSSRTGVDVLNNDLACAAQAVIDAKAVDSTAQDAKTKADAASKAAAASVVSMKKAIYGDTTGKTQRAKDGDIATVEKDKVTASANDKADGTPYAKRAEAASIDAASSEKKAYQTEVDQAGCSGDIYMCGLDINTSSDRVKNAEEKYKKAVADLEEIQKAQQLSENSGNLSELKSAIDEAKAKLNKAKDAVKEAKAAQASAVSYSQWANALIADNKTKVYGQAAINENGKIIDADGNVTNDKSKFVTALDNDRDFDDDTDVSVIGRDSGKFTYNLVEGDKSVSIPYSIYRAYVQRMYEQYTYNEHENGKGIATNGGSAATMPTVYWVVDKDGKLTGESYLSTESKPDGKYFVGYVLKAHGDGYHIDGTMVSFTNPTPEPTPVPEQPTIVTTIDNAPTALASTTAVLGARRAPEAAPAATEDSKGVLGAKRGAATGDDSFAAGWIALMAGTAGVGAVFMLGRRKSEKDAQ